MSTAKLSICEKNRCSAFYIFSSEKFNSFFERKKMRFSLSALQFGKELLEVKSKAEQKQFSRDICFFPRKYETHTKNHFLYDLYPSFCVFCIGVPYEMLFPAQRGAPRTKQLLCGALPLIPLFVAQASEREKAFFILQLSSKRTLFSVSAARAFSSLAMASLASVRRAARRAGSASWACFSS